MKAMVYTAPRELQMLEIDEPEPGPGETLIRVLAAGICGSELEGIRSESPFRVPPLVMGHEFCGTRVDIGQRVVVNPIVSCHVCDLCLRGMANLCRSRAIVGIHRQGAFAEYVAVPTDAVHALDDGVSDAQAALVEPLANAVHAWGFVADMAPRRVGVFGAGTIGLVSLIVAASRGAEEVVVADRAPERLEIAARAGASQVGPALSGEFDLVIDAVGAPATRQASVEVLRPGGAAVWLGLHAEEPGFDSLGFIRAEKRVFGSFAYTDHDFRQAVALVGRVDASWVTSFPLDAGVDIFTELMNGRVDVVKAQLQA